MSINTYTQKFGTDGDKITYKQYFREKNMFYIQHMQHIPHGYQVGGWEHITIEDARKYWIKHAKVGYYDATE